MQDPSNLRLFCPWMVAFFLAAQVGSAQTTVVAPNVGPASLPHVNGNKVVVGPGNTLHTVYASAGKLRYTTSTTGGPWSAPVEIANRGAQPTIAVTSSGDVGVAFVDPVDNKIYYVFHTKTLGTWSLPVLIAGVGAEPSMVSYQSDMHLVWLRSDVQYTRFPATAPPAAPVSETVLGTPLCGFSELKQPSIAITRGAANNFSPLIRVAVFWKVACPPITLALGELRLIVMQRPGCLFPTCGPWPPALDHRNSFTDPFNTEGISLSLAGNASTGDFYVAESKVIDSAESTSLWYQNAWTPNLWKKVPLPPGASNIDVTTTFDDCVSRFRVAYSENVDQDTFYRTGSWTGVLPAPTWAESAFVPLSQSGRHPQAVFWQRRSGLLSPSMRIIHALYDEEVGGLHSIVHDATTVNGFLPQILCPPLPVKPTRVPM